MSKPSEVVVAQVNPAVPAPAPSSATETAAIISMLERAARDPSVDIDKMDRLLQMSERIRAREFETAFNAAMAAAQSELVPIAKKISNPHTRSKYADIAAIADGAMPTIHKHGFGLSFSEFKGADQGCVGIACDVTHSAGHCKRYEFNVPIDGAGMKGGTNKTATQAYGSTTTYGRRYATCMVFNIATKNDTDGNAAPVADTSTVTDEQAETLRQKIAEAGADINRFLRFFKASSIPDMRASDYDRAVTDLNKKIEINRKGQKS